MGKTEVFLGIGCSDVQFSSEATLKPAGDFQRCQNSEVPKTHNATECIHVSACLCIRCCTFYHLCQMMMIIWLIKAGILPLQIFVLLVQDLLTNQDEQ